MQVLMYARIACLSAVSLAGGLLLWTRVEDNTPKQPFPSLVDNADNSRTSKAISTQVRHYKMYVSPLIVTAHESPNYNSYSRLLYKIKKNIGS